MSIRSKFLCVSVAALVATTSLLSASDLPPYYELGVINNIEAGKTYEFKIKTKELAPGWGVLIDPFAYADLANVSESETAKWARVSKRLQATVVLKNTSKDSIIDVAETAVPFSSKPLYPGDSWKIKVKDLTHQVCVRKLRGTDEERVEDIEFDLSITFSEDLNWPRGVHVGLVYVAQMHQNPDWFHESTRNRNWKRKQ